MSRREREKMPMQAKEDMRIEICRSYSSGIFNEITENFKPSEGALIVALVLARISLESRETSDKDEEMIMTTANAALGILKEMRKCEESAGHVAN